MKTQVRKRKRTMPGIRLQDAVVIALVILLITSIGIASTLWYWNGRRAVGESARRLQTEIGLRIEDHIRRFLAVPQEINTANAAALGLVDLEQFGMDSLESLLLSQIAIFESVSSIYVGSPEGGLVDAGREGTGGPLYVIETEEFRRGAFNKYSVDSEGHRGELLQTVPDFDARTRPWFQAALEAGTATWSDIYVLFSGQDMAIAASRPIYDSSGDLVFVLSSDIFLSQIDDFMRALEYGTTGLGFIVDRAGYLVASSDDAPHLVASNGSFDRILATDSASSLISQTAQSLQETLGRVDATEQEWEDILLIGRDRFFVQVHAIEDAYGIDWLSVIVIPEADFLGSIIVSSRITLVFLAIALAIVIAAGILFVKRITRPLENLTLAAQSMGEGEFVPIPHSRRIREIRALSNSFEEMGLKLGLSMASLQNEVDERTRAQQTLQESETRLRMVIERSPVAIFVSNAAAQYVDVNPAACKMTGYSRDELLKIGIRGLIGEEEREADPSLFDHLKKTGVASGEIRLRKRDGSELWVIIEAVALSPDRLVAFCADITRRRQTEDSLRHQQKMESLGTMASGVAHEINNPLMGMMSYSELLEARMSDPDAKEYARNILREGERIAHIIRNLLSFAREEKGSRHLADIQGIIADSLPLVHNALLRSHVSVQEDYGNDVPEVACSRQQIQQVIVNLLMNARDALDIKYPQYDENKIIRITVRAIEKDGATWVRTSIVDHGMGMKNDQVALAFDPFFTTRPRNERTGLGLTISFGIVRENGGEISIESEEGEGTTVHVDLPTSSDPTAI